MMRGRKEIADNPQQMWKCAVRMNTREEVENASGSLLQREGGKNVPGVD